MPIVQTFKEADLAKDGRISHEEWLILVQKQPVIINYMTLPVLREVGLAHIQHACSQRHVKAVRCLQVLCTPPSCVADDLHAFSGLQAQHVAKLKGFRFMRADCKFHADCRHHGLR